MKTRLLLFLFICLCSMPPALLAQTNGKVTSPLHLMDQARELFRQKNYAATIPPLRTFMETTEDNLLKMEAEYMLASSAYELQDRNVFTILENYLERYPDSPYANRIYTLMASVCFFEQKYDEALALFNSADLDKLSNDERDDMTYRVAVSYMAIGNVEQAAVWFQTLKNTSNKYNRDASYYIAYIRYTQKRYDEALQSFLPLQDDSKYRALVPYYIADIYLQKNNYDKAEIVAQNYLSAYPTSEHAGEMHRILGESYYHWQRYDKAVNAFENYASRISNPQRNALYMMGISYYNTGVFSKTAETLGTVVTVNDALTQNAYLHMGLAYLEMAQKNNARMAFEQAAASDFDMSVKEQASYNYALAIYETSFSAFGESVTAFERFLNEFPNSTYRERASSYLTDVYLTTRSYDAALKSIERIKNPDRRILGAKQKILFQLGTQAFANAAFEESISYLNQSILLGQYDREIEAEASYWRGEAYYRLDRIQDAARNFNDYLRLTKKTNTEMYVLANYNLGYIAFHQKNYSQARDRFSKYVQLEKNQNSTTLADAYNRIGDSYFQTRSFDEAKRYYAMSEAMETSAGDYSFYQLALVSGLQKDYTGKITILNRLIGKYPSSPFVVNAIYEKGRSYVLMGNNNQAIGSFRELVDKYPNSPLTRKAAAEIGLLYYQNEDYNQAIAAYQDVVKKYPGSEEARLAMRDLKSIYIDLNRVDEFANLASTLPGNIRFDASEQDSLTYIAAEKVYMRGKTEEARESFNRYLQSFPQGGFSLNAHYYLALISNQQHNYEQILHHTGKLLEYPDSPFTEEALVMRGEIQYNQQQYQEALATYKQLNEKATTPERRMLAKTGVLRSAFLLRDRVETIHAATDLLAESKLSPELKNEALYYRAKAYVLEKATQSAMNDFSKLAEDTRNSYGAEAKYQVAQLLYNSGDYAGAEKVLLDFIEKSTPHAYWLARGFVLLSDVYVALGRNLDARQYLLSLQQNYQANDDIQGMIESRLQKLTNE